MSLLQQDRQRKTDRRTDRQTDGRTDREGGRERERELCIPHPELKNTKHNEPGHADVSRGSVPPSALRRTNSCRASSNEISLQCPCVMMTRGERGACEKDSSRRRKKEEQPAPRRIAHQVGAQHLEEGDQPGKALDGEGVLFRLLSLKRKEQRNDGTVGWPWIGPVCTWSQR